MVKPLAISFDSQSVRLPELFAPMSKPPLSAFNPGCSQRNAGFSVRMVNSLLEYTAFDTRSSGLQVPVRQGRNQPAVAPHTERTFHPAIAR